MISLLSVSFHFFNTIQRKTGMEIATSEKKIIQKFKKLKFEKESPVTFSKLEKRHERGKNGSKRS